MQEPAAYRMTSTLFGYALHPIHVLLGGSVTALRIFGLAVLAASGAAAAGSFLSLRRAPDEALPALCRAAVVAAGAALPAMYYGFWLPTPSYNWLVLVAALLLLPAIVLLADRERGPSLPAALAALAGLIAAMAKPPAAGAFAALYLAATVLLLREPRRIGVQLAFAFGFTAAGVAALAALLPLETVWAQTRGYIEMHGAAPPAGRGAIADLLVFLVRPRGWPFVAALIAAGLAARAERSGLEPADAPAHRRAGACRDSGGSSADRRLSGVPGARAGHGGNRLRGNRPRAPRRRRPAHRSRPRARRAAASRGGDRHHERHRLPDQPLCGCPRSRGP